MIFLCKVKCAKLIASYFKIGKKNKIQNRLKSLRHVLRRSIRSGSSTYESTLSLICYDLHLFSLNASSVQFTQFGRVRVVLFSLLIHRRYSLERMIEIRKMQYFQMTQVMLLVKYVQTDIYLLKEHIAYKKNKNRKYVKSVSTQRMPHH